MDCELSKRLKDAGFLEDETVYRAKNPDPYIPTLDELIEACEASPKLR
jgi:hypothetical protein